MKNTIFNTTTGSYPVSHIVYASSVWEIPEDRRKGDRTHAFKIVTTVEAAYCKFRSFDAAVNSRTALGAMIASANPHAFRHANEIIDAQRVVSISNVIKLKTPQGEYTHAVILGVDTHDSRNGKLWLKYKSEETAKKGRRLLFAVVAASHNGEAEETDADEADTDAVNGVEEDARPEIEVATAAGEQGEGLPF
jgi:hypothetical protein